MRFILGSSSPRRKELLEQYGIKFEVISPGIDEIPKGKESAKGFVQQAARDKLQEIIKRCKLASETLILTADTIVVLGNKALGKPRSKRDAINMLKRLQGRWHSVYTSYCIYYNGRTIERTVKTDVRLRALSENEIRAYIDSGEPMDKAGAYAAQGRGAMIIKEIRGSYTNVVGLPMAEVIEDLKRLKIRPKP